MNECVLGSLFQSSEKVYVFQMSDLKNLPGPLLKAESPGWPWGFIRPEVGGPESAF